MSQKAAQRIPGWAKDEFAASIQKESDERVGRRCAYCGDFGHWQPKLRRVVCRECEVELMFGYVPPSVLSPVPGVGGVSEHRHSGPPDDDIGSYRTIAVRCLEDGWDSWDD